MSNRRRFQGYSGIRYDLPHLRLQESSVTADFDDVLKGLVTGLTTPFIARGFNVIGSTGDVSSNVRGMRLSAADALILASTATEPGTILRTSPTESAQTLDTTNPRVIGDWVPGVNYVSLDLRRVVDDSTVDQTAGWSPSEKDEIQKSVPIGYILDFRIIITTTGYGTYLPLYKVTINSSEQITEIEIGKDNLFRLGKGGAAPNPAYSFPWFESGGTRLEGPTSLTSALSTANQPWSRGDWSIANWKQWMDAVMTRFKEITGSSVWYADSGLPGPGGGLSLSKTWFDANGSLMTSAGSFSLDIALDLTAYTPSPEENDIALLTATINSSSPDWDVRVISTSPSSQFAVTQRASSGLTRTLTLATPHTYAVNQRIQVVGVGPAYDGIFINLSAPGTTLVYTAETILTETTTASAGDVLKTQARGSAKNLNGSILRVSSVTGAFSPSDNLEFRISQAGNSITRSGSTATLTVPDTSIYGADGLTGDQFIANLTGATEQNFNVSSAVFTIASPTTVTYTVANAGAVSEAGTFNLDAVLASWAIASNADAVEAGPLAWTQDFYVRAIIGYRQYVVPYDATAQMWTGTGDAGIYGPGTVNLSQEGRIAFLLLHRDLPVGTGTFNIVNSNVAGLVGSAYDGSDGSAQVVAAGDYVKIDTAPDTQWYRVDALNNLTDNSGSVITPLINESNARLLISKGTYDTVYVADREDMPDSVDVYWLAYREDRGSLPVVYLRELELEAGEEREINDNVATNLLRYTGAMTESAIDPNYTQSAPNTAWEFESAINVLSVDVTQNIIYLDAAPENGIQQGDQLVYGSDLATVAYPLDASTFVSREALTAYSGAATYRRPNASMDDVDNLTKGMRKVDRLLARLTTIINRPIYDESTHIQSLALVADAGAQNNTIRSGYWITTAGGGLAWVLAASNSSDTNWQREVRNATTGAIENDLLLIHVISSPSEFISGATILQSVPGASSATRVVAAGGLAARGLYGDPAGVTGQILRLPPNTRAGLGNNGQSSPTGGNVQPYAAYNAKPGKGAGELLIVANDQVRECGIDYLENDSSSGPARFPGSGTFLTNSAQIQLLRSMPVDTRVRFRNLATFGLPPIISPATFTLQTAYDGPSGSGSGRTVTTLPGLPAEFNNANPTVVSLSVGSRMQIGSASGAGIQPALDLSSSVGFNNARIAESWVAEANISSTPAGQWPGSEWKHRTAGTSTPSSTLQTVFALTLGDQRAYRIKARVVGRRTDVPNSGFAAFTVEALVYRDGGSAVLASPPATMIVGMTAPAAAYVATIDVSGNNVRVRVAGDTGHTVEWVAGIEWQSVSTAS